MMKSFRWIVGALTLAAGVCFAGEPAHELDEKSAVKLIHLLTDDHQERIQIVMVREGAKVIDGLEDRNVSRVMAIHPVPLEGKRVRRVQFYDFQWNDDYGWYCMDTREERGVHVVYIFSELKGEVVVK